jgi:5'-3' exonuclease
MTITTFKQEPKDPKNTLIVDGLNLAFRWKHAGDPMNMPSDFNETIASLARSYDCGQILVLADGGSTWRKSLLPTYKQTRRIKSENASEEEKKLSKIFFEYYDEALQKCKFPVIKLPGVEADDIAAYIVENKYTYDINSIWLISSDKDWDLLIEPDISRFSTVTRKEITVDTWPYEVSPEKYIDFKTLTGDKGDDIPGVEGVGPVRAKKLLDEYGDIFDIIAMLPLKGTAQYINNLNKSKDIMLLGHSIMDLRSCCEDAIGEQLPVLKQKLAEIYGRT